MQWVWLFFRCLKWSCFLPLSLLFIRSNLTILINRRYLTHYRNPILRRVPQSLSCAEFRAHGNQSICREPKEKHTANKRHTTKITFAVCLKKKRTVKIKHTATWFVCHVPNVWHTANRWPRRAVCLTVGFAVRFNWHTAIKIYTVCFCSLPCA